MRDYCSTKHNYNNNDCFQTLVSHWSDGQKVPPPNSHDWLSVSVTVNIKWCIINRLLDDERHMYMKKRPVIHALIFQDVNLVRHEGWALIGWRVAERNSWLAASPCCQLVADDSAVCDDLTETQLQVNLSLRRRERTALPWLHPPPEERERERRRSGAWETTENTSAAGSHEAVQGSGGSRDPTHGIHGKRNG